MYLKKFLIYLHLFLLLLMFYSCGSGSSDTANAAQRSATKTSSNTWATKPDYASVMSCISNANSGDTINVLSGSATWDNPLIITKGIMLKGAGAGQTIITSNIGKPSAYLIQYKPDAMAINYNDAFRVSGFTFILNNQSGGVGLYNNTATLLTKIRIDNNNITVVGGSSTIRVIGIWGTFYGVIDSNTIVASKNGGSAIKMIDSYGNNNISWNYMDFSNGSENNIYYEDNVFSTDDTFHSGGMGGRYVARYNTYIYTGTDVLSPWFDVHGNQHNFRCCPGNGEFCSSSCPGTYENWSTMGVDIYGNTITSTNNKAIVVADLRGGKNILFNNKIVTTGNIRITLKEECRDTDNPYFPSFTAAQPMKVHDNFFWNNRSDKELAMPAILTSTTWYNGLAANVDFFNQNIAYNGTTERGVYCGSSLPASCSPGDGAWITAQSCDVIDDESVGANANNPVVGEFFKCTATDTWTSYYKPYKYPHPMR